MNEEGALADLARRQGEARTRRVGSGGPGGPAPDVRTCIEELLDPDSFQEIGTLAHSERPEHAASTPGDGKIGGHGTVGGRPVTVVGDDASVKRASTAMIANAKVHRLFEQAENAGNPFVYLGQTGGARLPDVLGSTGHSRLDPMAYMSRRRRRIPLVSVIIGPSFGGSSLVSALSDLSVQIRGTCLAVTSPAVIRQATGEDVSFDALGGVDVHLRLTSQIDVGADDFADAAGTVRRFLSHLPPNAWSAPPRRPRDAEVTRDEQLASLVPANQRMAYDMREVLARLLDHGELLELRPQSGAGVVTGLGWLGGHSVGVVASQPLTMAGAIVPKACDKIVRLLCTCDAFGLPVVFLQDTPGFLVGRNVEHEGLMYKAMLLHQAVATASVPILTVIVRKSYGLATACLGGMGMGTDLVLAWPGARIGFMDPHAAASVLEGRELEGLAPEDRRARIEERAAQIMQDNSVYGAAGAMRVDEVIHPGDTKLRLVKRLDELAARPLRPLGERALADWPVAW